MEASFKIFNPSTFNRHFSNSLLKRHHHPLTITRHSSSRNHLISNHISRSPHNPHITLRFPSLCTIHSSLPISSISLPISNPLGFFQSLSLTQAPYDSDSVLSSSSSIDKVESGSSDSFFEWKFASEGANGRDVGIVEENGPIVTVVLLGWLGAKLKHLRRYAEFYNSRGIHAVSFVASVQDVLSFDLGRRLIERVSILADEIASWLSKSETDGRERVLLFHTFSNTGWLTYGAIIDNFLQHRQDLLSKIRGCVVDSGADPELNPQVWAAGFTSALLQKKSSSVYSPIEVGETETGVNVSKMQQKDPLLIETLFLFALEKLFSFLLNLPSVNRRLMKIISILSNNQPDCPQLYLYSTTDKVIPFRSVESFLQQQRRMGRMVCSFNFGSSPHVDHLRTFPTKYSSQLQNFLKKCFPTCSKF